MRVRDPTTPRRATDHGTPEVAAATLARAHRGGGPRFAGILSSAPAGAPAAAPSIERVLIGARPDAAEARIRITDGSGGIIEIRLAAIAGGRAVAAQVLTAAASLRETLSNVMREVRLRLRRRGIALEVDGADAAVHRGRERRR